MKRLIAFMQVALTDVGARCGISTSLDLKTIEARLEHEGTSFLTISLPNFCTDFEKSLDQGFVAHDQFSGFSRNGGFPKFLQGFLGLVFDRTSGQLLPEPSVKAIQAVRQITLMFGKMLTRCSPEREKAALQKFRKCEEDVRRYDELLLSEPNRSEEFSRISRMLWADFFSHVDSRVYKEGVLPKHGPGATADKLRGNAKYNQRTWTRRMDDIFPHWENLVPSPNFTDRLDGVTLLEPGDERPVKVTLVPKTLKTPRIIAIEPTCMQYMQQGILATIMEEIPRFNNTRHFLMFESQEPNQRLAREGSLTGALATLDLSEASDRVSNRHVKLLLANHRELRLAVDATRSLKARMPDDGEIIPLAKFASMGSALCFPFEALVFVTIVFLGIERALNRPLTRKDIESMRGKVRVYGDDIIVPVEYVQFVIRELEAFGLQVNSKKSFWTGKFRESCGKEYYDGHDICVARVRRYFPSNRQHVDELVSAVSLRNQMFHLKMWRTVDYLDELIGNIIPFPFIEWELDDWGNPTSSSILLGRHSDWMPIQDLRLDLNLYVPLVKGVVVKSVLPESLLDDYGALMKWFLMRGDEPLFDRRHLERAGRPGLGRIKTRWAPLR